MTDTTDYLDDYYAALKRLIKGRPERVPEGTRITNDAVALEAGRGKGSIKKSRPQFQDLICDIAAAAKDQPDPKRDLTAQVGKLKSKLADTKKSAQQIQDAYEQSLMRELSLLRKIHELEKESRATKLGRKGPRPVK